MGRGNKIELYDTQAFTTKFMPSEELKDMIKDERGKFFIVKMEEMYKLVTRSVPASRSITHTCLYVTSGEAIMKIGGAQYTARKDEMLFVQAGQVFSFVPGNVSTGYLCNFHNDILISKFSQNALLQQFEFLRVWGNPYVQLDKQTSQFVLHLFKRLLVEYSANGTANPDIIQPYFITLLCEVNRVYKPLFGQQNAPAINIINRFKELLFANIKEQQRVADFAALLNISPNHLNKTVKTVTGKSPVQWISEAIVAEAKILLCQSDLSISEIATEVGLEDQSYFTRLFKKHENITPTVFRKMIEIS